MPRVGVAIRNAQRDDLPALLALYRELNPDDPPLDAHTAEAVWERIRSQAGRSVLVADTGSSLVGTLDCHVVPNLTRGARSIMFVENVVVGAAHRRRGIGGRLLDHAIGLARSAHCYKAQLLSAADPPAHDFYAAQGFTASARGYRRYL
jgi:GNAT superfamily N-acetyltransferase